MVNDTDVPIGKCNLIPFGPGGIRVPLTDGKGRATNWPPIEFDSVTVTGNDRIVVKGESGLFTVNPLKELIVPEVIATAVLASNIS